MKPPSSKPSKAGSSPTDASAEPLVFPASFAQKRLWFLHYLEPDVASYNLPVALRLKGPLDAGALEETLNEILRRHDVLRTSFPVREGVPVQVISPARQVSLAQVDLRDTGADAREREATRLASAEAYRPFDLAQGPLFRAKLFRLGEEDHVLIATMHHIVSDGWSIDIFRRELADLYAAFRLGEPSPLSELPIQYADYALWQQSFLSGEVLDEQLDYWKKNLEGIPALLEIPTDRPRPAVQTYNGASVGAVLPPGLLQRLNALARQEGSTLFMTCLAAFQGFLARYTGQDDIPVGSPIAGRTQVETEGLIGFFVNTLVLRGDVSGDPTFRQLLARVRETALEAYAHQDLPFEKVVEELQPARTLSYTPLFQVLFQLTSASAPESVAPELKVQTFPLQGEIAKFDLSLRMLAQADRLSCVIEYKTDLFDAETIRRMMTEWQRFLIESVSDPDRRVSEIPLLDELERRKILFDWNATSRPYPDHQGVAQAFEEQAAKSPDRPAIVFEKKSLTYSDLNTRANRIAFRLRQSGVGAGSLVGICLERSFDLIAGLLAILKAGGAYVPLDPSYPRERLGFLIRDTGMKVLLTDRGLAAKLPREDVALLLLDEEAEAIESAPPGNPIPASSGDSLAYVMYTSGSTGSPKGVLIPQRGVLRLVKNGDFAQVGPDEVFLQLAPVSFDASTFEIWGPLLNGGRLVLFPSRVPTASDLRAVISEHGVSTLWLTASLFNTLVDADPGALAGVRQLLIGGEALSVAHVRQALEALPSTTIVNGYGPTESTTFACCYTIPRHLPDGGSSIPIGRPISNTRVHILDRKRNPVPIGVPGELYIGGDGLARGYLNSPELTAERFVPDLFSGQAGERLYRTGDLARYRSDGLIEFVGRLDKQVKIRGYRIEPGEIEAVLTQHPEVGSAAVVAGEDLTGGKRLVAYIVRKNGKRDAIAELRNHLSSRLPDYMIPSAFVVLGSLPLISSGKVDWRALPQPGPDQAAAGEAFLPHDTLELVLLRVWEEVLGLKSVGVSDNFFELGGHSLLAVRLFSEIEKTFGRTLPLATLFQAPTVGRLAAKLRQEGWEAPWSSLVVIQGGSPSRPPFLCVPGVGGNILGFYDLARQLGPEQSVYGLQAQGLDGKKEPFTRIEDMAAHYVSEIRGLLPDGPFLLGGASFGGSVAFEMARQLEASGSEVSLVALFDTFAPGVGGSGPASSVMLRQLKAYRSRFLYHGKNLLFGRERGKYIRSKSRTLRRRIRSRIWQMIYNSYRGRSKPLPRVLQDVREAGYLANKEYMPRTYRGKVTLFRAGLRSAGDAGGPDMGWSRLALGGVEIREVPGDHVNMLLRPQVGLLAEQLRDCIDRVSGKSPAAVEKKSGVIPA